MRHLLPSGGQAALESDASLSGEQQTQLSQRRERPSTEHFHASWHRSLWRWLRRGVFLLGGVTHTSKRIVDAKNLSNSYITDRNLRVVYPIDPKEQIFVAIMSNVTHFPRPAMLVASEAL